MSAPVAVALVSWNTRELLRRCLRSLEPDAHAGRAEVWVVDNASSDDSPGLVRREFPWASLLALRENVGYGPAVNLVAARTSTPWLAPANADVELSAGALEALLETGEADPMTAIVAPRLLLPDGSTQHSVYPFPTLRLALLFNLRLHRLSGRLADRLCLEGFWDPARPREVAWAIGAFLLVRRAAFDGCGGFDPAQWMYAEDLDLGWRLRRDGWRTRYEPRAVVRHEGGASTRQAFGDERTARWMAASYAWMLRRRGRPVTYATAALNLLGVALPLLAATALAPLAPERFRPARAHALEWLRIHRRALRHTREPPRGSGPTAH